MRVVPSDRRGGTGQSAGGRGRRTAARPGVRSVDAAIRRAPAVQSRRSRCCGASCRRSARRRLGAGARLLRSMRWMLEARRYLDRRVARRPRGQAHRCGLSVGDAGLAARRFTGPRADDGGARCPPARGSSGGLCRSVPGGRGAVAWLSRPICPNLLRNLLRCKNLLDEQAMTADILGVVQRTISLATPIRNRSHGRCPPQLFRFRRDQDDGRFPLSSALMSKR